MAFLFKSKKGQHNATAAHSPKNDMLGSQASITSANGRLMARDEKGATVAVQSPASSVNNSLNSLGNGTGTPSPEQLNGRRTLAADPSNDLPLRNGSQTQSPPSSSSNAALYPWSQRRFAFTSSHPSPFPRYGAAANGVASKEGDVYLMGGLVNSSTVKGDLWMIEAGGTMACYPLPTSSDGPGPRVGHASLLVGNAFIVYGGDTKMDDGDVLDETLYLLNTSTRQWARALPPAPRPLGRYGHTLNILGAKIFVFGGQVEGFFMNDLVAFDLNKLQDPTNRWEVLSRNSDDGGLPPGTVPPPRTNHTMLTFNDKLYLFGGTNGFRWFNDVWCYDAIQNNWTQLDCIGYIPAPREGHAAALVDDVMYIFGGRTEDGADLGDLAAFRITTRRWYTFQNMGPSPSPRSGHCMTTYNKQVIVFSGEPSSATSQDLTLVYVLDTTKIRYPNDQQIQSTPSGERVPGARRPSADKTQAPASRGLISRDAGSGIPDPKKLNGSPREGFGPSGIPRTNGDVTGANSSPIQSKLPRASMAGAPAGPPPPGLAPTPTPRVNGVNPAINQRSRSRQDKVNQSPVDVARKGSVDQIDRSITPTARDLPPVAPAAAATIAAAAVVREPSTSKEREVKEPKPLARQDSDTSVNGSGRSGSKTRHKQQQSSLDSITEANRSVAGRTSSPPPSRQGSTAASRKAANRNSQTVNLLKELDTVRNRNAWYASELELARKGGYVPNMVNAPPLDQNSYDSFGEDDRPLIEALIAMRTELANVQSSIDKQAVAAAKRIAEVEKQRDAAVSEAVYAKAKLAAHGGSTASTPQLDNGSRDLEAITNERSADISRKLAAALAEQAQLKNKIELLTSRIEDEKRSRQLAEDTSNAAQRRITELELYKQQNVSEVEQLKAELHELEKISRDEAITAREAVTAAEMLKADKELLDAKLQEALGSSKDHSETLASLSAALAASAALKTHLEEQLEQERTSRENIEERLLKLRIEHEERSAELEVSSRKLRDAEELAEKHAHEARTHREAVLSGLNKITVRDTGASSSAERERSAVLEAQLDAANALVRKCQAAADAASEKLRSAEERIAGLEAYQEQASREGLTIRKQLQAAMRETQSLQASNTEMKHQLSNQQLETNAVHVQHNTLKDILGERGLNSGTARSRGLSSPSGTLSPDTRVRELEQQLAIATQSLQDTRQTFETREKQAEAAYKEKLVQLESDYQSAVHYVKGTEKMLKRMKDELTKYKTENARMKAELDEAAEAKDSKANEAWEEERGLLQNRIDTLQATVKASVSQLEAQLAEVRTRLESTEKQRDQLQQHNEDVSAQLADLVHLQEENALLEKRAQDAEQKVSVLLDQVESSVDNYRRQSRQADMNGAGHHRSTSGVSISSDSVYDSKNRNSMALDSLASELETLRTQWETTNKNYRHSNAFELEPPLERGEDGEMSSSVADWRKRLEQLEDPPTTKLDLPVTNGPDAAHAMAAGPNVI